MLYVDYTSPTHQPVSALHDPAQQDRKARGATDLGRRVAPRVSIAQPTKDRAMSINVTPADGVAATAFASAMGAVVEHLVDAGLQHLPEAQLVAMSTLALEHRPEASADPTYLQSVEDRIDALFIRLSEITDERTIEELLQQIDVAYEMRLVLAEIAHGTEATA